MEITRFVLLIALLNSSNILAMDPPKKNLEISPNKKCFEISLDDQTQLAKDLIKFHGDILVQRTQSTIPEMVIIAEKNYKMQEFHLVYFFAAQFKKWSKENQEKSLLIFSKEYYEKWIADQKTGSVYDSLKNIKIANKNSEAAHLYDLLSEAASHRTKPSKSKKGIFGKKYKREYAPITGNLDNEITTNEDEIFASKIISLIYRYYYDLVALREPASKK